MLVPMSKVYIVGLKDCFFETLNRLQEYGKLHLADLTEDINSQRVPIGHMVLFEAAAGQLEEMQALHQRANALITSFFGKEKAPCEWARDPDTRILSISELIQESGDYLSSLEPKAQEMLETVSDLVLEQAELIQYEPLLSKVEPIVNENVSGEDLFSMALIIESRFADSVGALRKALIEATSDDTRVISVPLDAEMNAVIIISDHAHAQTIRNLLIEEQFTSIKLPAAFNTMPFSEALAIMRERLELIGHLVSEAKQELALFAEQQRARLCFVAIELENRIAQLKAVDQFGETKYSFVMVGYHPKESVDELRAYFDSELPNKVLIEEHEIPQEDYSETPVEITNPEGLKGFQAVMGIWGTPTYGSFDASKVIAFSFPILFAFIVGDFGYGSTLLFICLALRLIFRDNAAVKMITSVFIPVGIATMIVGIFYWEMFGDLALVYIPGLRDIQPIHFGEAFSIPFIRTHGVMMNTFLFIALGIGVVQVSLGLIMGIINNKRLGHKKHIFEKAGILTIIFAALFLVAVSALPGLTAGLSEGAAAAVTYVIYLILGVGFVIAMYGGGIMGAIETIESAAHIASYIRIMAVGLVGALLADAANKLAFVTMPNAAGIILALILHVLNFVIIVFSPSIHALRLTFLEFFGKFWVPTKVSYKPFARVEKEGR